MEENPPKMVQCGFTVINIDILIFMKTIALTCFPDFVQL